MPTVHARNLFHVSAAMWDAWAAYSPDATGYFVDEEHTASDIAAARDEAISYAAYRVLESRYMNSGGASDSIPEFDALMAALYYPTDVTTTEGGSPAAVGNRIAAADGLRVINEVDQLAADEHRSRSELIREALRAYLEARQVRKLQIKRITEQPTPYGELSTESGLR